LRSTIKHDFMKPDKELTLDLTLREAEILASASSEIRAMAESGDLKLLHEKFRTLTDKVSSEYLKVRDHIDRII
jgi:hypothetical protein